MPWLHINPIDEHAWSRSQRCGGGAQICPRSRFFHSCLRAALEGVQTSRGPSAYFTPAEVLRFLFSTLFLPLRHFELGSTLHSRGSSHGPGLNSGWQLSNVGCTSSETDIDYWGLRAATPFTGVRHPPGHVRSAAPSDSQASTVWCFLSPHQYPLWSYLRVAMHSSMWQGTDFFFLPGLWSSAYWETKRPCFQWNVYTGFVHLLAKLKQHYFVWLHGTSTWCLKLAFDPLLPLNWPDSIQISAGSEVVVELCLCTRHIGRSSFVKTLKG